MQKIAGGPRQLSAYTPSFDYLIINVCINIQCTYAKYHVPPDPYTPT